MEASDSRGCTEDEFRGEELDFTERLPADLLVKVLTGFTLNEAARTSAVSRRWRHLWKSAEFLVLDFDAMKEISLSIMDSQLKAKRLWYINWVNGVVTQLQQHNSNISKFRLAFPLNNDCNFKGDIDRWLLFAISKRVESLDLSLVSFTYKDVDAYVFSEDCYRHMKTLVGLSDIKFLRSLRLLDVNVRGEIVEHVIANCPSLEELAVHSSPSLTRLRVVGPLQLKHLEVTRCRSLEYLEIDHTPHLVRFTYGMCSGMKVIRVGNCPHLVDLELVYSEVLGGLTLFGALSGCASQLESLFVRILLGSRETMYISHAAEHTRLRQLTFEVHGNGGKGSFLKWATLINKCPRLHTLQVLLCIDRYEEEGSLEDSFPPLLASNNVVKARRESIKVVEIVGFNGYPAEVEFVNYVMDYFVCLERIVIDRRRPDPVLADVVALHHGIQFRRSLNEEESHRAGEAALELKSKAAPTLDFIVI